MDQELNFKYISILNDPQSDKKLSDLGYAIFPLLSEKEIKAISDYYFANETKTPDHFYSSTHSKDLDFRKRSSDFIKRTVSPLLLPVLKNYKVLGGAFVVKPANGKGMLEPHQDWNIVDEEKYRSYNLWIPLVDVNVENGAVFVQNESHRKIKTYRGPGIPSAFNGIESLVWTNLHPLPMKAGQALLYDHALIHGSPNNTTNMIRIGIVVGIIPEKADMQLYFGSDGEIKSYKADEFYFMEKDPSSGPQGLTYLADIESNTEPLSATDYQNKFLKGTKQISFNWIKKLLWK